VKASHLGARFSLVLTCWLAYLPLPVLRAIGYLWGYLLYAAVASRRHVVRVNLQRCFPELSAPEVQALSRRVFVRFAQAWLDRGWLWAGSADRVRARLRLSGEVQSLEGQTPTVIFAPHFVGLDAGWTALTQSLPRHFTTIYTHQANRVMDAWILQGRQRFGSTQLFGRRDGVKTIVSALKQGDLLYLLPDMDFGVRDSVFVPFYGINTATVSSLSRFARLARAQVVPVVTRMTDFGYEVNVLPAWTDFPTVDAVADTALMNARLQTYIDAMPEQYYWVHRRFKGRPEGEASFY
jgi:KDO2-lipid IV(A) lauroyltransferase